MGASTRYALTMPQFTNLYPSLCSYFVRATVLQGRARESPGKEAQTLFLVSVFSHACVPMAIGSLPPGQS